MVSVERRVLVVDDSETIRRLIVVNLELEGFVVDEAADGAACLARIPVFKPHLITIDVVMPRLDGFETLRRIRADQALAAIKVVMVSGKAQDRDITRATDLGANAYVAKPFDPARLVATVRELA
jgi:DNA-binding response OmpR family regulator